MHQFCSCIETKLNILQLQINTLQHGSWESTFLKQIPKKIFFLKTNADRTPHEDCLRQKIHENSSAKNKNFVDFEINTLEKIVCTLNYYTLCNIKIL